MKKIFVISVSLFFIGGLSFIVNPSDSFAEEKQPAVEPQDWESLPPEMKNFFLDSGKQVEEEEQAVAAASQWLKLVDEGKYKDACENVEDYMIAAALDERDEIDQCIDRLKRTRHDSGPIIKRRYLSAKSIPDESLIEITFDSASEKKNLKETIIIGGYIEEYYIQEDRGNPKIVIPYYP